MKAANGVSLVYRGRKAVTVEWSGGIWTPSRQPLAESILLQPFSHSLLDLGMGHGLTCVGLFHPPLDLGKKNKIKVYDSCTSPSGLLERMEAAYFLKRSLWEPVRSR